MLFFPIPTLLQRRRTSPLFHSLLVTCLGLALFPAIARAGQPAPKAKVTWRQLLQQAQTWLDEREKQINNSEFMAMYRAVLNGSKLGPGEGWFGPSQSRYDWNWLAQRYDTNKDGKITSAEFAGAEKWLSRLDRDRDGMVVRADLDWSDSSPAVRQQAQIQGVFRKLDRDGNGQLSAEEWQAVFPQLAQGRDYLLAEDLQKLLAADQAPRTKPGAAPKGGGRALDIMLKGLLTGELGSPFPGPRVNDPAPDFVLKTQDGQEVYSLADFRGKKPVVLIFGSFT
jgi:Ca2+-binding EF-hand superfamily protein